MAQRTRESKKKQKKVIKRCRGRGFRMERIKVAHGIKRSKRDMD
jgi:hypothetical protein